MTFVEIPGVIYQVSPEYVLRTMLDPLARFVLEATRHEHSIPRLFNSFGLPPRMLEDILGDLVRLNLVNLNLSRREVHPTRRAIPIREAELRRPVELWQDSLTGAVLEWSTIGRDLRERPNKSESIEIQEGETLLDLPHGRILGMLERSRSRLLEDRDGWRLERLLERYRLRVQSIFINVLRVGLADGHYGRHLHARNLPLWVVRNWSRGIELANRANKSIEASFISMRVQDANWWTVIDMDQDLREWQTRMESVLFQQPPPRSISDLGSLWRSFDALIVRLKRQAKVKLEVIRKNALQEYFTAVFRQAFDYLIIALPTPHSAWFELISTALEEYAKEKFEATSLRVWLIRPVEKIDGLASEREQRLRQVIRGSRFECHLVEIFATGGHYPAPPATGLTVIIDGRYACVALAGDQVASTAILNLEGEEVTQHILASAEEWVRNLEVREVFRNLVAIPAPLTAMPSLVLDVEQNCVPDEVVSAEDQLQQLRRHFIEAIAAVQRRDSMSVTRGNTNLQSVRSTPGERLTERLRPLKDREPTLSSKAQQILLAIGNPQDTSEAIWAFLRGSELETLLEDAFGYADTHGAQGEIVIAALSFPTVFPDRLITGLKNALGKGWRVMITWGRSSLRDIQKEEVRAALRLRDVIGDSRLTLRRLQGELPVAVLMVENFVAIGFADWLSVPTPASFAYIFRSPTLRRSVTELIGSAQPISEIQT